MSYLQLMMTMLRLDRLVLVFKCTEHGAAQTTHFHVVSFKQMVTYPLNDVLYYDNVCSSK